MNAQMHQAKEPTIANQSIINNSMQGITPITNDNRFVATSNCIRRASGLYIRSEVEAMLKKKNLKASASIFVQILNLHILSNHGKTLSD